MVKDLLINLCSQSKSSASVSVTSTTLWRISGLIHRVRRRKELKVKREGGKELTDNEIHSQDLDEDSVLFRTAPH